MNPVEPSFQVGGTLDPRRAVYVRRAEDEKFMTAASKPKSWINVYGCKTMGKSSLYVRHIESLANLNVKTIMIDLASEVAESSTATEWFLSLSEAWTYQIGSGHDNLLPLSDRSNRKAAGRVARELLTESLLSHCSQRILLVLDEYNYTARLPYHDEILYALRNLQAIQARSTELDRLSVCLVGWRPITHYGRPGEPNTSPICAPIEMLDFGTSAATLAALREGFPPNSVPDEDSLMRILALSGGQPLVTMELLSAVRETECSTPGQIQALAESLVTSSGTGKDLPLFAEIERAIAAESEKTFAALSAYKAILDGSKDARADPDVDLLRVHGLLRRGEDGLLESKGGLFRRRFDAVWADRMMSRIAGSGRMQQYRGGSKNVTKRICVINAGGTLGMVQRGEEVVPPADADEFRGYFTSLDTIARTVEFINLFPPRDSINMFPGQWATIARYIYHRRHDRFDGFVVAHGTDTMAYTASAVAFALGPHLSFPVVFTGAQTTPDVAFGDAHVNLYRACEVAKVAIPEVVISFGNFVYRAVRAQKKDDRRFDGFESPTYPPLAEITGEINVRTELVRRLPEVPGEIELQAEFERSILIVPQFPGLEPGFFSHLLSDGHGRQVCRGVIVQTLGAGNVTTEDPYSFIPFVERAYRRGIPVIVTSQ